MTNDKLADEIERQLRSDGLRIQVDELSDASPHAAVHRRVQFAAPSWKQIIAALRAERPQSVEMVMVPRSFAHTLACRLETEAIIGDERSLARKLRDALAAAEAETKVKS